MKVGDLVKGNLYFSRSHKVIMKYCGVEYFNGYKYHNFFDPEWKLFHWLPASDVTEIPKRPEPQIEVFSAESWDALKIKLGIA